MEPWQKSFTIKNLCYLVENTSCNDQLLLKLVSSDILGKSDEEKLNAQQEPLAKSRMLYEILQSRKKGYETITKALLETNQTGVARLLLNGYLQQGKRNPLKKCGIYFDYQKVLTCDLNMQGSFLKWNEVFPQINEKDLQEILDDGIHDLEYLDVITSPEKVFHIATNTVPKMRSIYISRSISNRVELNPEIFTKNVPDVFIFKGIDRVKLTEIARGSSTSTSGKQLLRITSRFVLLDDNIDWDEIRKAPDRPVHLIKYEEVENNDDEHLGIVYILEDTNAKSDILWSYVSRKTNNKLYIPEEKFVKNTLDSENSSGICICDSPGMGKSMLLQSLSNKLKKDFPERIVLYFSFTQFINSLKPTPLEMELSVQIVRRIMVSKVATSSFSQAILLKSLERHLVRFEVFFDGVNASLRKTTIAQCSVAQMM